MSPIDFDILQAEHPERSGAWTALQRWFVNNSRKQYVELSVLLRALKIDRLDLVLALQTMVDYGMLEIAYRVKAPAGHLLAGDFSQPELIPEELPDRDYSGYIRRADSDIVSGYRWGAASVA